MTWIKLDDAFTNHPKITALTPSAFRLHVAGLCYCGRYLTDGFIPAKVVPNLIPQYRARLVDELTTGQLWVNVGLTLGYEIHDYLAWNPARAEVEKRRAIAADNARQRWRH